MEVNLFERRNLNFWKCANSVKLVLTFKQMNTVLRKSPLPNESNQTEIFMCFVGT